VPQLAQTMRSALPIRRSSAGTFQVMRRTLGTDLQQHGTIKDAQGVLRHASIKTTGDVYVQQIPKRPRGNQLANTGNFGAAAASW
jgi:hypothetical protein